MTGTRSALAIDLPAEAATIRLGRASGRGAAPLGGVALDGELGTGKTRCAQGIAEGLGIEPREIRSPTFGLLHEHAAGEQMLVHVDAYRIDLADDETLALVAAAVERTEHEPVVVVIEWAARIEALLPNTAISGELRHVDETTRAARFTGPAELIDALRKELAP